MLYPLLNLGFEWHIVPKKRNTLRIWGLGVFHACCFQTKEVFKNPDFHIFHYNFDYVAAFKMMLPYLCRI